MKKLQETGIIQINPLKKPKSKGQIVRKSNNINYNKINTTLTGHSNYVMSLVQLSDGKIASSSEDKTIKLWDLKTNLCTATLTGHTGNVFSVIQIHKVKIVFGSPDKTIKVWNLKTN